MAQPMRHLLSNIDTQPLLTALNENPQFWNEYKSRTDHPQSPHREADDIFARYGKPDQSSNIPHEAYWYPCTDYLPVRDIAYPLMNVLAGDHLGGILITRIKAGKQVYPHVDTHWHAKYYQKYLVTIQADEKQVFHFEGLETITKAGDLHWFDNSKLHWVTNDSDIDRISLIICINSNNSYFDK